MLITIDKIITAGPCYSYPHKRVAKLVRSGLTPRGIARLEIPIEDRLWTIIYVVLNDRQCRLLACDCAERTLEREHDTGRKPDLRSWAAVKMARKYAHGGATNTELDATRAATRNAANNVARAAARNTANNTAKAAAWSAAGIAAWDAARIAAWDAERE